jgi:hypothetical protein
MCDQERPKVSSSSGSPVKKKPKQEAPTVEERLKSLAEFQLVHSDDAMKTVIGIITKIQNSPNEMKFRRLLFSNEKVRKLGDVVGLKEFLTEIGFKETSEGLVMNRVDTGLLWVAKSYLVSKRNLGEKVSPAKHTSNTPAPSTSGSVKKTVPPSHTKAQQPTPSSGGKKEKPIEKKLAKLAKVLAADPVALDTVATIISTIQSHPTDAKYKRLRWSNKKFEKTVRYASGATTFLKTIGFEETSDALVMHIVDPTVLWAASSCLEAVKKKPVYKNNVAQIEFKQIMAILAQSSTSNAARIGAAEVAKRKDYEAKVPVEPGKGEMQQTRITVILGDTRFDRRFPSDSTMEDILHYTGSLNSIIPQKIRSKEWTFLNTTMFPSQTIDYGQEKGRTLYSLELWPSGVIEVVLPEKK